MKDGGTLEILEAEFTEIEFIEVSMVQREG